MKTNNRSHPALLLLIGAVLVVMLIATAGPGDATVAGGSFQGKAPVRFDNLGERKTESQSAAKIEYHQPGKTEQAIESALDSKMNLSLSDILLSDAVKMIAKQHKIPILIMDRVLTNDGVNSDLRLNYNVKGISLRNSLNIILKRFEPPLTYVVEDDVLKITTITDAEERLQTRVYGISHLKNIPRDRVKRVIWSTTTGPWRDDPQGGEGVGGSMVGVHGGLVIRQDYMNHREIRILLEQLTRQQADVRK